MLEKLSAKKHINQ